MRRKGFLLSKVLPCVAGIGLSWVAIAFVTQASQDAFDYSSSLSQMKRLQTEQAEMDERLSELNARLDMKEHLWDALVEDRLTCKEAIESFIWLNQHSEYPNPQFLGSFETKEDRDRLLDQFLEYHEGHHPTSPLQNEICTVFDKWSDEEKTMGKISPELGEKSVAMLIKR